MDIEVDIHSVSHNFDKTGSSSLNHLPKPDKILAPKDTKKDVFRNLAARWKKVPYSHPTVTEELRNQVRLPYIAQYIDHNFRLKTIFY